MADKLLFKWNNFQSTVSQSFGVLRKEEDFFDVTLVSDQELQVSAHKLILSASSSFFKSILRTNSHSHPLIYLSGVSSENLSHVLDYIYQGQVELREDQVESFLSVSTKLKIDGIVLDSSNLKMPPPQHSEYFESNTKMEKKNLSETKLEPEPPEPMIKNINTEGPRTELFVDEDTVELDEDIIQNIVQPGKDITETIVELGDDITKNTAELEKNVTQNQLQVVMDFSSQELRNFTDKFYITDVLEADRKILELMTREESGYSCRICAYTSKFKHCTMGHIENRHIRGLAFNCEYCDNRTFKNRNQLANHRSKFHSRRSLTL